MNIGLLDMSSDQSFGRFCDEFNAVLTSLRRKVTSAGSSMDPAQKQALLQEADHDVSEATSLLENIDIESRSYEYRLRAKSQAKIREFKRDFKDQQARLYAARNEGRGRKSNMTKQEKEARKMVMGQHNTLDQSDRALDSTLNKIAEIQTTGGKTNNQLISQTEQLTSVRDNLDDMEGSLGMSKRVIKRMQRRVATSKLLSAFIILMELGIIVLIIYLKYYI